MGQLIPFFAVSPQGPGNLADHSPGSRWRWRAKKTMKKRSPPWHRARPGNPPGRRSLSRHSGLRGQRTLKVSQKSLIERESQLGQENRTQNITPPDARRHHISGGLRARRLSGLQAGVPSGFRACKLVCLHVPCCVLLLSPPAPKNSFRPATSKGRAVEGGGGDGFLVRGDPNLFRSAGRWGTVTLGVPPARGGRLVPPTRARLEQPHGRHHSSPPQPCALTTTMDSGQWIVA